MPKTITVSQYRLSELECWTLKAIETSTSVNAIEVETELSRMGFDTAGSTEHIIGWINQLKEGNLLNSRGLTKKGKNIINRLKMDPTF